MQNSLSTWLAINNDEDTIPEIENLLFRLRFSLWKISTDTRFSWSYDWLQKLFEVNFLEINWSITKHFNQYQPYFCVKWNKPNLNKLENFCDPTQPTDGPDSCPTLVKTFLRELHRVALGLYSSMSSFCPFWPNDYSRISSTCSMSSASYFDEICPRFRVWRVLYCVMSSNFRCFCML